MRILIASDHYPPLIGGAQIQTRLLATGLAKRGHEVAVATTWQRGHPALDHRDGFPIHRLRQLSSCVPKRFQRSIYHQPPFPDPVTTVALRRVIHSFKPDVVHSHGWFTYSCAAALLSTEIPLVVSARDYGYSCATRTMLYMGQVRCTGPKLTKCLRCSTEYYGVHKGWLATLAVRAWGPLIRRKTAAVHSVSNYVRQIVNRDVFGRPNGANPRSLAEQVIHELVDMSPDGDDPGVCSVDWLARLPSEPFILFVGALRREKGVYVLLEAYRQLISPPPLVLLIGTLERDLPESFPPGVVVISEFPHGAMTNAWDRALFGVMPSLLPEPMGTVVCEALSCGRAVIGAAHGGHPDIITDGVNGLLVPPGDTDALITAMRSLLDNPQLRTRLTRGAGRVGRRFATEQGVERFEQLYRAAVAA